MKRGIQIGLVVFGTLTALGLWRVWALIEVPYTRVAAEITAARDLTGGYPPVLVHALLAAEDPSFIEDGRFVTAKRLFLGYGRASLTVQLVRGLGFVDPRPPSKYAVQVTLTSVLVDLTASKSGIVAAYLSSVYMGSVDGSPMFGFREAARRYLGKPSDDLTIAESALLAGIVRSPSRYSPLTHRGAAEQRSVEVLRAMLEHGFISEQEFDDATRHLPSDHV